MPIWAQLLVKVLEMLLTPTVIGQAKTAFVKWLVDEAAKTDTPLDDEAVKVIEMVLGVPPPA